MGHHILTKMKQYLLWLDHRRGLSQQVEVGRGCNLRYPSLYSYRVRGISGNPANPYRKLEVSIPSNNRNIR